MECLSSRREREAPGGRARKNPKFIQGPSPEIWSETISGGEEVLAQKWGGLFWATSLEKIFGGVIAIISFRQEDGCSSLPYRGVLSLLTEAREASGSEETRVHHATRRRGGVADRGARAATAWPNATHRRAHESRARRCGGTGAARRLPAGIAGGGLGRRPQRADRNSLGRGQRRANAQAGDRDGGACPGRDPGFVAPSRGAFAGRDPHHPDRIRGGRRSRRQWFRR